MTSKGKKSKKKNDTKAKLREEAEKSTLEKANLAKATNKASFNSFFTNDEITELKLILKTKDLSGIPFIVAATILEKLELIKKLLKLGYKINESSQNNTTALIWAVKYKYTDVIEFLLAKGADPTVKTESGENILIIALEHKLWDEQSFIKLWKSVNAVSFIDVNFCGKNGHNMLHMAIRRDWETFVTLLLNEKPNIDAANVNGITPLMLACFRNNINIVNRLLNNKASIIKEDTHRRTALCYAITAIMKGSKPPYVVAERILTEMKTIGVLSDYIKMRLEIISLLAEKPEIPYATSEMLNNLIHFIIQYSGNGLSILLKLGVFEKLKETLQVSVGDPGKTKFFLSVILEILFYSEQSVAFTIEVFNNMVKAFCCSKILDVFTEIIRSKEESNAKLCFYCLILTATSNEEGKRWLKENYLAIAPYFDDYISDSANCFADFQDDRLKIMKRRLKKVKRFLSSTENAPSNEPNITPEAVAQTDENKYSETMNVNSKKTKRRSKALKAKIAKIKVAELSERVNLSTKKPSEPKLSSPSTENVPQNMSQPKQAPEEIPEVHVEDTSHVKVIEDELHSTEPSGLTQFEIDNPIVSSFKHLLEDKETPKKTPKITNPHYPQWKREILNLPFDDCSSLGKNLSTDQEKLKQAYDYLKQFSNGSRKCTRNIAGVINIVVEYFNELLHLIIRTYQQYWANTEKFQSNFYTEEIDSAEYEEKQSYQKKLEKYYIDELQKNYDQLISSFRTLASRNPPACYRCACKLEASLLTHEIRGKSLLPLVSGYEQIRIRHKMPILESESPSGGDLLKTYMEDVLNDLTEPRNDIEITVIDKITERTYKEYESRTECPNELYYREMSGLSKPKPRDKKKEFEASQKTLDNAYYLEESIMKLCDSDEDDPGRYNDSLDKMKTGKAPQEYSEILLRALTKHVDNASMEQNIPTRWSKFISSLKGMKNSQKLLNGDVRISCKEQRINHIISTGGNFNPVELGLDTNNRPLAVKRIPKESSVCKNMSSLIKPLLSLRNPHILHYYVCDYEECELILSTPLCEWNVGQYVLLMKQTSKSNLVNLSTMDIVRQFLSGLMFLHNHKEPITHGNLKPSNIFVDLKGVVRVAEFGNHQALFKIIEAPDTSLIWFSRETYQVYKQNSIMECNTASDIQVAGMLIHFILTGGKHPCGDGVYEILKNLEKSIPKLNTQDPILVDLVTWMMLYDPNERPTINQVLSHVFFWSSSRRWKYILTCAGITPHGATLPVDVNDLYICIDKMSKRENIKGNWVDIIRNKYPSLLISNEDTITGLLRFIRNFYEKQLQLELRDSDLSNCILAWFPALPLSLQRMLENTIWVQHPVFLPFNLVDALH